MSSQSTHLANSFSREDLEAALAILDGRREDAEDNSGSALPDPPPELSDAWERYQAGDSVAPYELRKLDEWRIDCARDAGF